MMVRQLFRRSALVLTLGLFGFSAQAQDGLRADLREQVVRVPAKVKDSYGKEVQGDLLVTLYKPQGHGPFPLAIISHGRNSRGRAKYGRQRYESAARYFVRKGFAVAVPLRLGYGELAQAGDPETSVSCSNPRFASAFAAAASQILTVANFVQKQPDIDPRRFVLVGVSVGGISTIAAASVRQPQATAAINFAGGHGGRPDSHKGEPCGAEELRKLYRHYGKIDMTHGNSTPTLWIYAENDRYFSPRNARRWAQAYDQAGGNVDLQVLPSFGENGHRVFEDGNDIWQGMADNFLEPLGFEKPGAMAVPESVGITVTNKDAWPQGSQKLRDGYRKFLAAKPPRAFAISSGGGWGYSSGDDAMSRALATCQRHASTPCKLHSVNEAVVMPGFNAL